MSATGCASAPTAAVTAAATGWLVETGHARRVFVELAGSTLELSSDTSAATPSRELFATCDVGGCVVTEIPLWRHPDESIGKMGQLTEIVCRFLVGDSNAWQARRDATERFAHGFTVELRQPDSNGRNFYTFCLDA